VVEQMAQRHPILNPKIRDRAARLVLAYKKRPNYNDQYGQHKTLVRFPSMNKVPVVHLASFVAPSATIVGQVLLGRKVSVWNDVVIRGETNRVEIGGLTNIQDKVVICEDWAPKNENHDGSTIIASSVSIDAGCVLRACTIRPYCWIGAGSVLKSGCFINSGVILLPGTVVPENFVIPPEQVWGGNPATFVRHLEHNDEITMADKIDLAIMLGLLHSREYFLPSQTAYLDRERLGFESTWKKPFGSSEDINDSVEDMLQLMQQHRQSMEDELDDEIDKAAKELLK